MEFELGGSTREVKRGKKLAAPGAVVLLEDLHSQKNALFAAEELKTHMQQDRRRIQEDRVTASEAEFQACVSALPILQSSIEKSKLAKEEADQRQLARAGLYCWCKQNQQLGLIGCNSHEEYPNRQPPCRGNGWYHFGCVNITEDDAEEMLSWTCGWCVAHPYPPQPNPPDEASSQPKPPAKASRHLPVTPRPSKRSKRS